MQPNSAKVENFEKVTWFIHFVHRENEKGEKSCCIAIYRLLIAGFLLIFSVKTRNAFGFICLVAGLKISAAPDLRF